MSLFGEIPLVRFIRIARKSGGIDAGRLHHLAPWVLKLIIFEPFRITESLLFNKKVRNHKANNSPLFILGFYRTGTTYLQRLFAQNEHFAYQTVFQSALPELMLGFEWLLKPILSIAARVFRIRNDFHKVPFTWNFPGEEDVALTGLCIEESPNWGNLFPRAFFHYYDEYAWSSSVNPSSQRWKAHYNFWVKKLSLKNGGRRLVLKSPPNTARIETLLELFPDARFICIHRNPYYVFNSSQKFWQIINRFYAFQKISESEIAKLTLESFDRTMVLYHRMKDKIPPGNLHEITHESLTEGAFDRFKRLYENMGFDDFNLFKDRLHEYITHTSNYPFTHYKPTPGERQLVEHHWQDHIDYWIKLRNQGL